MLALRLPPRLNRPEMTEYYAAVKRTRLWTHTEPERVTVTPHISTSFTLRRHVESQDAELLRPKTEERLHENGRKGSMVWLDLL